MRSSGGLMSNNSNLFNVLQAFLKGHVGAIVAMVDHSHYLKLFMKFVKFIWKVHFNACLMILMASGGRLAKWCHRNCEFEFGFCMFFDT